MQHPGVHELEGQYLPDVAVLQTVQTQRQIIPQIDPLTSENRVAHKHADIDRKQQVHRAQFAGFPHSSSPRRLGTHIVSIS